MKVSPLKIGFGVSILCHVAAFGFALAVGVRLHPPSAEHEETPVTITLIAAPAPTEQPAAPVVKTVVVPVVVQPVAPPVEPKPMEPAPRIKPAEEAVVTQPPPPPVQTAPSPPKEPAQPPVAVAQTAPPTSFRGDASSLVPGKDFTTVMDQPVVKAKPSYLKNPEPPYPVLARRRHQEGVVILSVSITETGTVANLRVKESSHFPLLDQAAVEAVRNWTFEPGRVGSRAVPSEVDQPVRFQLAQ